MAMQVRATLGLDPWDTFHQGVAERTSLSFGTVTILVGVVVLLLWIPLRQRPGLGTVSNVLVIGLVADGTLWLMPQPDALAVRIPLLLASIVLNGVATGLYISARFGPGPRDGLTTGLHRRSGRSIRLVRTGIELTVLATGFLLGGSIGVGTVLYAVAIGPLSQFFLRIFDIPGLPERGSTVVARGTGTTAPQGPAEGAADTGTPTAGAGSGGNDPDSEGSAVDRI
ncbi:YczE/YyaS/YitT family protein [Streptomyces palmae]|uniref:membrane protein YczE n=1 Tax=Streptomyces palmae TaxID=1701085 RepID=UPI001FD80ECE|nr:hypothetical protein [Streptomyces palmae]